MALSLTSDFAFNRIQWQKKIHVTNLKKLIAYSQRKKKRAYPVHKVATIRGSTSIYKGFFHDLNFNLSGCKGAFQKQKKKNQCLLLLIWVSEKFNGRRCMQPTLSGWNLTFFCCKEEYSNSSCTLFLFSGLQNKISSGGFLKKILFNFAYKR